MAPPKDPDQKKMEDRLTPRMEDRLGSRLQRLTTTDTRKCNNCGKVGHIARFCKELPPPPPAAAPTTSQRPNTRSSVSEHRTEGATCTSCKKTGHVADQCWSAHPEKQPMDSLRKRNGALAAMEAKQKRQRAASYMSPEYDFQAMALTYVRPTVAMMQQRAPRVAQPSRRAMESAAQAPSRRVEFAPLGDVAEPVTLFEPI